jgi:diaminopimelate decarboxylase
MLKTERDHHQGLAYDLVTKTFAVAGSDLMIGGMRLATLAEQYATPLFVYDATLMRLAYRQLADTVAGFAEVYFSIKANPNPAVARVFVEEGAGLEIASGAEYVRARAAAADPDRILFAGPGKGDDELKYVIQNGIGEIHLESYEEIDRVAAVGALFGRTVPVAVRVNPMPGVQGGAMRMGGKPAPFGFDEEEIDEVVDKICAQPQLDFRGIHLFAGTQIFDAEVLVRHWAHALSLGRHVGKRLCKPVRSIDLGGGLGIPYFAGETALDLDRLKSLVSQLASTVQSDPFIRNARIILEPGRFLVGSSGIYIARVLAVKLSRKTRFLVTDGGMHHHLAASGNLGQVIKRDYPVVAPTRMDVKEHSPCVIVGPLCTPLDTICRHAELPELQAGDLIAILQSGAYGLTASPNGFLSHPMPVEVLVDKRNAKIIRPRGTFEAPITPLP